MFLGEHTLIGRRAAIKILLPELSSRRDSVDRFFNEARATTAISDPGIVQVFDFGFTPDKVAYIVMELLEGEQLNVRLARLGALSPADGLRITRQAAGSLGAAHAAGIVHRDLKPENLYMIRDPEALGGERPKILDFGIAKLGDEVPDRVKTRTGAVLGTPVYMSPEQCNGAGRIDHRADIYALGCVLFHLLTGRPPFDLPGVGAIISAHLREPAPPPSSIVPHLPPGIDELVLRCLAKSPDERFATMAALQQACDALLALITRGSAQTLAIPSGSIRMPIPLPTPVPGLTSAVPPEAGRTTLSTSAGQLGGVPRRRLGLWIAAAALAGGVGSTIAVLTTRTGASARGAAAAAVGAPGEAAGASPAPPSPAPPSPAPPSPAPAMPVLASNPATPTPASAAGVDAGTVPGAEGSAAPRGAPPRAAPPHPSEPAGSSAPATRRLAPARPPAPPKSKHKPENDDVYDDRN